MARKFDFKSFLINHGEKIVAGIVVLLGLFALSSASWSGYQKTPEEMQLIAEKTASAMEVPAWSDEEREKFAQTPNVRRMAQQIAEETTERDRYATSRSWNEPLIRRNEKRTAVVVLAPHDPEISVVSVPIALRPEETDADDMVVDKKEEKKEEQTEEEKARMKELLEKYGSAGGGRRAPGAGGAGAGAGYAAAMGGAGGSGGSGGMDGGYAAAMGGSGGIDGGYAAAMGGGGGMDGGYAAAMGGSGGMGGGYGAAMGGGMDGGYGAGMGGGGDMMMEMMGLGGGAGYGYGGGFGGTKVTKRVRLSVGASVRMVVDLREQRKIIADALHIPATNVQTTQQFINYVDLHIERQQPIDGPNPWAGEWEPVRIEDIKEAFEDTLGVDRDIVTPTVTRSTITMPLPRRAAGIWRPEEASHNRLENFELSPEEQELINKMNELILERANEARAVLPPQAAEQKGFSAFVRDVTQVQQATMGAYGGADRFFNDIYSDLEEELGDNKKLTEEEKRKLDSSRYTADNRLLLVRFMDFTVERGKTYRYRVRLEMRNPNFDVALNRLAQPELGDQKTLMSEWSEPTAPVSVPMDYRYYVARVDGGRPGTGEAERAEFPIFYEYSEAGMPVMGDVKVPVGMPIGGFQKRQVVNLAEETRGDEDVHIRTRDLLAAAIEGPKLSGSDHPDLEKEISRIPRGEKPIPDQVVVLQHDGTLAMRASGDRANQEADDRLAIKMILDNYEAWDTSKASAADGLFGDGGSGGYGAAMMGTGMGMGAGNAMAGQGFGYGGGGDKKMSSRERARQKRENPGAMRGMGGGSGGAGN